MGWGGVVGQGVRCNMPDALDATLQHVSCHLPDALDATLQHVSMALLAPQREEEIPSAVLALGGSSGTRSARSLFDL